MVKMVVEGSGSQRLEKDKKRKKKASMSMSPVDSGRGEKKRRVKEQPKEGKDKEEEERKHSADQKEDENGGSGGDVEQSQEEEEKAQSAAEVEEPNGVNKSVPEDDVLQKPSLAEAPAAAPLKPCQRIWSQEDEVAILKAIIKYMKANNVTMSDVDMKDMTECIKASCQFQFVPEIRQLRDKIWKLKGKYGKIIERADHSNMLPHEKRIFKLSKKVWVDMKNEQEISVPQNAKIRELQLFLKDFGRRIRRTHLKLESLISYLGSC